MKSYHEGKLYGGIGLSVLGILFLIENTEAYPFSILLIIIGILLIFFAFVRKSPYSENTSKIKTEKNTDKPFSYTDNLSLARELLVSYYSDLTDEMIEDCKKDEEPSQEEIDFLESKRPLIQDSIREYIMHKEERYGSFFLTADTNENDTAKHILSLIDKYAFSVTLYYFLEFDKSLLLHSKKEVVSAIQEVLDTPSFATLSDDAFKLEILKRLNQ